MILNPRRKCQHANCLEVATHGIRESIHCDTHAEETEYNLAERKCNQCGKLDILNKAGICVNFCSLDERDKIMRKLTKKRELIINKLLTEKIDTTKVIQTWRDEIIDIDCSRERPDFAYHCGDHIVIVEVDEGQHKSYKSCGHTQEEVMRTEAMRMYKISSTFFDVPVVWLRYNPDNYKNSVGKRGLTPTGKRQQVLVKWLEECISKKWETGVHVKYLFYDGYEEGNTDFERIVEEMVV